MKVDSEKENGRMPFTQQTRDTISANDHDKLVEQGVMLRTIIDTQTRIEQTIKDLIAAQASALTSWETKSQLIHDDQNKRISVLETALAKYVPDYVVRFEQAIKDIDELQKNKSFLLGSKWILFLLLGFIGWLTAISIALVNLLQRLPSH